MGVPAVIGGQGVEKIVVIELDATERQMLENSVQGCVTSSPRPRACRPVPDSVPATASDSEFQAQGSMVGASSRMKVTKNF